MNISSEMKAQIADRVSLISEMMALGSLCTPVEWLETPVMLIMHMSDTELIALHKRLMKTRRRQMEFGLNGRIFLLPRKLAISVVAEEIKARRQIAQDMLTEFKKIGL